MLLRNIDQAAGLCNGTRLRVSRIGRNVIESITLNGSHPNQNVLLHRMDMNPSESRWPFRMKRRQFPITLSFAMTINKSQGQSLRNVGLYLTKPVFAHGQLYVALSRVKSVDGLKVIVAEDGNKMKGTTTNVVYKEIFHNLCSEFVGEDECRDGTSIAATCGHVYGEVSEPSVVGAVVGAVAVTVGG
ncbi:ATP-dependent DNA helicase PIF1-like [Neltuma alba]|uniref:ATP-dependent DNA helicase PIF1-like n=1 Tax=Neltuma alba TaxID=207710 RepID=UPI0010A3A602|nr:ATP-dependent DNA helicase PIF1-like [Prosopis alba]